MQQLDVIEVKTLGLNIDLNAGVFSGPNLYGIQI